MYSKVVCDSQFLHVHLHGVSVPGIFLIFSLIRKIQQIGLNFSKVRYKRNIQMEVQVVLDIQPIPP